MPTFSLFDRLGLLRLLCLSLLGFGSCLSRADADAGRPNLLMIMVDDLGYSDLGCYGGEISTPNLDRLAGNGVRFTQFYNTAKCHSSRVSLLTGQYCIAAGDVSLSHAVTSAEVLRSAGYFTAMTGKWHLKQQPTDFGFDRYFGHLSGACNYFRGDKTFRLNGQPWQVPEESFYTTVADVDFAIDFLAEARQTKQPWHLYVAFNAPHAPLQALPEDYARYVGKYDAGWDVIRSRRFKRQQQMGLFPSDCRISPRPEHILPWSELSEARKTFESKRMTALAAMIDRVDQEVGRLLKDLQSHGELSNTLICFVSDNGACPYDRRSNAIDAEPTNGSVSWSDSTGWAWARNAPFRYYKQNQFEGGIGTPAIMHWPDGIQRPAGSLIHQPAHLIDLMPTFADLGGATVPSDFPGRTLRPLSGQSLRELLDGGNLQRRKPLHFLFSSDRAIRDGDWKAVSFRGEAWELYNLAEDRTELTDLADQHPQRLADLVETWTSMAREIHQAKPNVYRPVGEARLPHRHPEWTNFRFDPRQGIHAGRAEAEMRLQGSGRKQKVTAVNKIRARKNTKLVQSQSELHLSFSGEDAGLALDRLPDSLISGPYSVAFELKSDARGKGDVFFTTDNKTSLPNGIQQTFDVVHDEQWHQHRIELATEKSLVKLRLDVGEHSGEATIRNLRLLGPDDQILIQWPLQEQPVDQQSVDE